jgi:uncharacterized protein (TIGR03067 family)
MSQDLDFLQGTWCIASLEMDGMEMPCGGARMSIEGDRFTTAGMGATYSGNIVLHPETAPRSFELRFLDGPEKGNTSFGIYELAGDAWKICLTTRGQTRPTEFAAPPGTGIALEVLRRGSAPATQPDAAQPDAAQVTGEPAPELAGEWVMASLVMNGDALPKAMVKLGRRQATAGEVRVKMGPDVILKALYSVDRSASPMTMDYWRSDGSRQFGIWKFEGGELTTCFGGIGEARPDGFASTKGDKRTFAVWRKA